MLSLTIFAVAAQAATQPPAADAAPPFARDPKNVVMPERPENLRVFTEWGLAEAVIDGDRVWLSGVVAGLVSGETAADAEKAARQLTRARRKVGGIPSRRLLEHLRERLAAIERIDFFGSAGRDRVLGALRQIEDRATAGARGLGSGGDAETPIYRPWIYAVIALLLLPLVVRDRLTAALITSGLLYELSFFPVGADPDYRYSHWMIASCVTAFVILFVQRQRKAKPS